MVCLNEDSREAKRKAIVAFASKMAGSNLDLDTDLESAAVEHLLAAIPDRLAGASG